MNRNNIDNLLNGNKPSNMLNAYNKCEEKHYLDIRLKEERKQMELQEINNVGAGVAAGIEAGAVASRVAEGKDINPIELM